MTRVGMNPARHRLSEYRPARVTLAVLVYLPHLSGYFARRLDVVKLSLASLLHHTDPPYDLLVFDNGSCAEVRGVLADLHAKGRIQYLITSKENVGKLGALRIIAGAAPGELIAYTDDDTWFYPGWLPAHLQLFDSFPTVGMVSGSPERSLFDHGIRTNLGLAQADPSVRLHREQVIPDEWERDWAAALGKDPDQYLARVLGIEALVLERGGVRAFATACHNQFVIPSALLQQLLKGPWPDRLMGGLNEFDEAVDGAGYLRLTTTERTTRLIGNIVGSELAREAARHGVAWQGDAWQSSPTPSIGWGGRLARWRPVRKLLQGLYNRLFTILSGQAGGWRSSGTTRSPHPEVGVDRATPDD
jgi:hypothetical protein